jgi:hypothetical protein
MREEAKDPFERHFIAEPRLRDQRTHSRVRLLRPDPGGIPSPRHPGRPDTEVSKAEATNLQKPRERRLPGVLLCKSADGQMEVPAGLRTDPG